MQAFHAICGTPRSGSTLLCNLLNQNPAFYASSTSSLGQSVLMEQQLWSRTPTLLSDRIRDREQVVERFHNLLRAKVSAWHAPKDTEGRVLFDKDRSWTQLAPLVARFSPATRLLVTVRDPRNIFASMERRNRETAEFVEQAGSTIFGRAQQSFGNQGLVGGPMTQIENLIAMRATNAVVVRFESFVERPEIELKKLYVELGLPWFEGHDFDNVKSTATDVDTIYLDKFPHVGSGKVEPPKTDWRDYVPAPIAENLIKSYPLYCQTFGYA